MNSRGEDAAINEGEGERKVEAFEEDEELRAGPKRRNGGRKGWLVLLTVEVEAAVHFLLNVLGLWFTGPSGQAISPLSQPPIPLDHMPILDPSLTQVR